MSAKPRSPMVPIRYAGLVGLVALAALTSGSRGASQVAQTVGGYVLVSEEPLPKGGSNLFTYRAVLTNGGGALASATATATSLSSKVKIVDGTLTFGPVGPGGTIVSSDTFSLSRNPKGKFDWADVVWTVTAVPNHPPVAHAGADFTRRIGETAQLDGSASSDVDGNALTYRWTLVSSPAGSVAALSDATAVKPTFFVDRPGTYAASLVVNDGVADSAHDTVSVSTVNSAPVANAGPDQSVVIQQTVTLTGSGSSDVDGDTLTFSWTFVSRPEGSAATLSNPTSVTPSFEIDRPGTYVVGLAVSDGVLFSTPDTVSISTGNSPPVANAGPDQSVFVTTTVTLDGSGSTDVDGDQITYAWALISAPDGSAAALDVPTAPRPTFVVDRPGIYVAQLLVHDGIVSSGADTVTITTENSAPVAEAGPAQTVLAGLVAVLDGSGSSDVDGDSLTYKWSFTSVPEGSTAVLSSTTSPTPSFTLDRTGMFVVQLIVNDGLLDSAPDTVTITTTNSTPVANAGADHQDVLVATSVALDGTQSADPDGHPLTYRWSLLSRPETSSAGLADGTAAVATIVPDVPGDFVVQLIVNDGFADSAPDTVLVHAVPVPVVTVEAIDPNAGEPFLEPGMFRFTRHDASRAVEVSFTIDGTATNGVDYQQIAATATFEAGQTAVDLAIAPADDFLVEGPESVAVTLLPGADYALGDPAAAVVTIADKPPITLALVDTQVAGVGIPATLRVTLGAAAPAGGVTVSVTSDETARLAVADPGSITIVEGETVGQIVLNGLAPATVTIRAAAANYQNATLEVMVTRNIISVPATFNVPIGQPGNLSITIERDDTNQGPVLINVTSDDASVISVTTPAVTVPAGETLINATVFGVALGSATLHATATNFASDSGVGTVAAALDITATNLTINSAAGGTITIELESPPGVPSAAPSGGIAVSLSAANPACVSVPSTVTIAAGSMSAAAAASYGGTATLPCSTTVTATGPAGFTSDSLPVTVNQAPALIVPALLGAVGGGLQLGGFSVTLSAAQQSVVQVHVESSDASRVLVASSASVPGAGAIDIDVPAGMTAVSFYVQGVDWTSGTSSAGSANLTFSAPGFTADIASVNYVQPALDIDSLPTTTPAAAPNDDFRVRVGIAVAGSASLSAFQPRRPGGQPLVVTVTNSNAAVAQIDKIGGAVDQQVQVANIAVGASDTPFNSSGGLEFDPRDDGTTVVSATIPGFITTTDGARTVIVTPSPKITMSVTLPAIGAGLQNGQFQVSLETPPPADLIVHLTSDDPSRVLLAPNATAPGRASIDFTVPSGTSSFLFNVQGTDWVPGSSSAKNNVKIEAKAADYVDGSSTIAYVQAALSLVGVPPNTTALSASTPFDVRIGVPAAGNTHLSAPQGRRPANDAEIANGVVPNLIATVTNSQSAVAQLERITGFVNGVPVVTTAQSHTTTIAVGLSSSPNSNVGGLRFDPLAMGTTVVTASIPGFIATAEGTRSVDVAAVPLINMPAFVGSIGGGLQTGAFSGSLGASQHPGVRVFLTSNDPSRVLLAPNATTPGTEEIFFDLLTGQTSFTFWVQGVDWVTGTSSADDVTITARATGFLDDTTRVSYVRPAVDLTLPATTTDLAANTDFLARVGVPQGNNASVAVPQARRAGAAPLVVTVTNSNEVVAVLEQNGGINGAQELTALIAATQANTPSNTTGGLEFDPLSTGTTTVTATIPNFITTTEGMKVVTVSTPLINMPGSVGSVGAGLQVGAFSGNLASGSQHGGVRVRLVSSDPSRVLLAPNGTTAGEGTIDIDVAAGVVNFTFVVQGTDWIDGTSSAAPVTITASAPGFLGDSTAVTYVQAAVDIASLLTSTTAGAVNLDFTVRVGLPTGNNTQVGSPQVRRGGAAPLVATVTNSDELVAEIDLNGGLNGAQSQTANIVPGQTTTPSNAAGGLEFDPKAQGSTVVTASIPGFILTPAATKTVLIGP